MHHHHPASPMTPGDGGEGWEVILRDDGPNECDSGGRGQVQGDSQERARGNGSQHQPQLRQWVWRLSWHTDTCRQTRLTCLTSKEIFRFLFLLLSFFVCFCFSVFSLTPARCLTCLDSLLFVVCLPHTFPSMFSFFFCHSCMIPTWHLIRLQPSSFYSSSLFSLTCLSHLWHLFYSSPHIPLEVRKPSFPFCIIIFILLILSNWPSPFISIAYSLLIYTLTSFFSPLLSTLSPPSILISTLASHLLSPL